MTFPGAPVRRALDVPPLARVGLGIVAGVLVALLAPWASGAAALLAGWATTALVFVVLTWAAVLPMGADETAAHATREEPTRAGAHVVVVVAAVVSLAAVAVVLMHPRNGAAVTTAAALAGVVCSWAAIHTVYALRYARTYCSDPPGGIDFHQDEPPRYSDFAYVALTVGMSFAISDTDLGSSAMRRVALGHALLSYLFGSVVIALLVNLVAGL